MLEKIFKLKEHNTDVKTEVIAGITTFIAMAYILVVNPNILGNVMNPNGVFLATAFSSAIATFIMAFLANYPIALSAGMGLNAYFAFTVCLGELSDVPNSFTIALTAVLVEGIIFILLSAFKFREAMINGIPQNLKYGITSGIGIFIAFIGLQGAGITVTDATATINENGEAVVSSSTLLALGDFATPEVVLAFVGFLIIVILSHYKINGSVLLGIVITWILGMIAEGIGWYKVSVFPDVTNGLIHFSDLGDTAFRFNFEWVGSHLIQFIAIVFSFLFVDLFDTVGTVVGVADKANMLDENGKLPRAGRVFMADAIGTTVGACLGTSTVTSFVESSAGVAVGGKTGLTSLVTGFLFLISVVLSPIFVAIPGFATAPALIYVGMLMFSSVIKIKFDDDVADTASAYMATIMMPLTYSIANGIMFGIVTWVIAKFFTKKAKEITPIMWAIFILFALRIITLIAKFQ